MCALALITCTPESAPPPAQSGLRAVTVYSSVTNEHTTVYVELATTALQRQRGLMGRTELAADRGMLFIFEYESYQAFWMRDTAVPLDMIFITANKTVAGCVANATPFSLQRYSVPKPSQYVLEVNAGFCKDHGIAAGSRVEF